MKYLYLLVALVVLGIITITVLAATELLDFVLGEALRVFLLIVDVLGAVLRLGS